MQVVVGEWIIMWESCELETKKLPQKVIFLSFAYQGKIIH